MFLLLLNTWPKWIFIECEGLIYYEINHFLFLWLNLFVVQNNYFSVVNTIDKNHWITVYMCEMEFKEETVTVAMKYIYKLCQFSSRKSLFRIAQQFSLLFKKRVSTRIASLEFKYQIKVKAFPKWISKTFPKWKKNFKNHIRLN